MYVNAHVVNQSRVTPGLAEALGRADLVYCDGYGVRLAARVMNQACRTGWTAPTGSGAWPGYVSWPATGLYLVGSEPPLAREAAARLRRLLSPARGGRAPTTRFFDSGFPPNERVIEDIIAHGP